MVEKQKQYKVVVSSNAKKTLMDLSGYLDKYYTAKRSEEIINQLIELSKELYYFPYRGKLEELLDHRKEAHRFLLYKRTTTATIKIIYWVDEAAKIVIITSFFPTEMKPDNVKSP